MSYMTYKLKPTSIIGLLLYLLVVSFIIFAMTMINHGFIEENFSINDWDIGANVISDADTDFNQYMMHFLNVNKVSIVEENQKAVIRLCYTYHKSDTSSPKNLESGIIVYKLQHSDVPLGFGIEGIVKNINIKKFFIARQSELAFISLSYDLCIIKSNLIPNIQLSGSQQCLKEDDLSVDIIYVNKNVIIMGWLVLAVFLPLLPITIYLSSLESLENSKGSTIFASLFINRKIICLLTLILSMCFLIFNIGTFLAIFPLIITPYALMILIEQIFLVLIIFTVIKVIWWSCVKIEASYTKPRLHKLSSIIDLISMIIVLITSLILLMITINVATEHLSLLVVKAFETYPVRSLFFLLFLFVIPIFGNMMINKLKSGEKIREGVVVYLIILYVWLFIIIFRVLISDIYAKSFINLFLSLFIPSAIGSVYIITHIIENYTSYKALYDFYYKGKGLRFLTIIVPIVIAVTMILSLLKIVGLIRSIPLMTNIILFHHLILILIIWFLYVRTNIYQKVFIALGESLV